MSTVGVFFHQHNHNDNHAGFIGSWGNNQYQFNMNIYIYSHQDDILLLIFLFKLLQFQLIIYVTSTCDKYISGGMSDARRRASAAPFSPCYRRHAVVSWRSPIPLGTWSSDEELEMRALV